MTELFVPYAESLELKKLGFDEPCLAFYDILYNGITQEYYGKLQLGRSPEHLQSEKQMLYIFGQQKLLAPLWEQAFDFFRKKYNWYTSIKIDDKSYYFYDCISNKVGKHDRTIQRKHVKTYEEARLECLRKLIEICQEQK
jgi:hypothetical protein